MIPVTAEDVSRHKRRIVLACLVAAAVIGFLVFWLHKRATTDPLKAQAALEAGQQLMTAARYSQAILNFDRASH